MVGLRGGGLLSDAWEGAGGLVARGLGLAGEGVGWGLWIVGSGLWVWHPTECLLR